MKFIKDDMRDAYINAIYNRIRADKSTLLIGKFGTGKSALLEMIKPKKKRVVKAESLSPLHYMLGNILAQMDFDVNMKVTSQTMPHLEIICGLKNIVILMDESNDLRPQVWPYLKRIMNAGIPFVFAGLPKTKVYLNREHEDILSRLKILPLLPVRLQDYQKAFIDLFDPSALEIVYGASGENMRVFDEICGDCLDKIKELNVPKVTDKIALMFI